MFTGGSPACDAGVTAATVGGAGVAATTAGGAVGGVITIVMSLVVATLPTSHVRSVAGSVCAMFARCSSGNSHRRLSGFVAWSCPSSKAWV